MATTQKNLFTEGTKGAVGKQIVFKQINGKTVVAKYPDMTNVQYNNVQKGYQSMFGQAVAFASSILKDPAKRAKYEKKIGSNKDTRKKSVYSFAIAEYMKANSRKVAKHNVKKLLAGYLKQFQLTDRQSRGVQYLIEQGLLSNAIYQRLNDVSKPTATRDLQEMVKIGVIVPEGRGAGAKYWLKER